MSYICAMDREGKIYVHTRIKDNNFACMKKILSEYWSDLTICWECAFNWYILADFCAEGKINFALGHALYMKSISGEKAKNDRIDSKKIAGLLRANLLPKAYVCPRLFRSHRQVVVLSKRDPIMKILVEDLEKRHGKRKARSVFVHKISRAIYYMLVKKVPFDPIDFYGRPQYCRMCQKAQV